MMKEEYRIYEEKMNKTLDSLQGDFASVRAGRANAQVLDKSKWNITVLLRPSIRSAASVLPIPARW